LEKHAKGEGEATLALPNTAITIPFGGSEQEFQAAVERLAKANPDAKVEGVRMYSSRTDGIVV